MKHTLSLVYLASSLSVLATGFSLNEMSSRGNALQGTLVGSTRDASAVFYNPANMTELEVGKIYTMMGVTFARPDYKTRVAGVETDQDESVFPLPHLYVVSPYSEQLAFGLGLYPEFGMGTCYEGGNAWPLAADSTKTKITSFTIAPSVAWKVSDSLSLGASMRVMYMSLLYNRYLPPYASSFHLEADDWTTSWQVGLSWKPIEKLSIGLVYRAESDFAETGDVEINPVGIKTGVSGFMTMPKSIIGGINYQLTDRLSLGVAITETYWNSLEAIDMHFESGLPDMTSPKDWKKSTRYSFGGEYAFNDHWTGLFGYTYDEGCYSSETPDTLCPQGDREQYGIGVSYAKNDWRLTMNYMLVIIHETDLNFGPVTAEFRNLRTDTIGLSYEYTF